MDFYSYLFHNEYTEDKDAFNSLCGKLPRVLEEARKELRVPLTTVLKSMQGERALGLQIIHRNSLNPSRLNGVMTFDLAAGLCPSAALRDFHGKTTSSI